MNIFYNNNTLYINLEEEINEYNMNKLKSRVFKIVRDYNIDDVILKVNSYKKDNYLLKDLYLFLLQILCIRILGI